MSDRQDVPDPREAPTAASPEPPAAGLAELRLVLQREPTLDGATLGRITIDGQHQCYTLEDPVRVGEKIPGETAIPAGTYDVAVTWSPRFAQQMPILLDVPGFEGVRIHVGNSAADTEGCILVGTEVAGPARIGGSRVAYDALLATIRAAIDAGRPVRIEIRPA